MLKNGSSADTGLSATCPLPASKPLVLVVDDHEDIRVPLSAYLHKQGFEVISAASAREMHTLLQHHKVDILVLDIMLTDGNGLILCRKLAAAEQLPVILLTAMARHQDRVNGLDAGADDYVVKPFDPSELVARIRSVLRRTRRFASNTATPAKHIEFAGWTFDRSAHELNDPLGQRVLLSEGEYRLLAVLADHSGKILSRAQLLDLTQPDELSVFDRSIDTQVCRLRKKLENTPEAPRIIKTIRGEGYLFAVPVRPMPA